jgi:putative phosphoesterase
MRAAVISDSHLSRPNAFFEAVYADYLVPADYVIHCGDHTGQAVWSSLIQHPGHISVAGNCDGFALGGDPPALAELVLEGVRVAAVHGWGPRPGLSARIAEALAGRFDVIFFGHSHAAEDTTYGDTRLINPGALTPGGSLALVDFASGGIRVEFVSL